MKTFLGSWSRHRHPLFLDRLAFLYISCYHNHITNEKYLTLLAAGLILYEAFISETFFEIVVSRRKTLKLTQTALSEKVNINRSILSRLEAQDYSPSVDQLLSLSAVLDFKPTDVIVDNHADLVAVERKRIAIADTGYVGLSLAILLSKHNDVTVVDITETKVKKINVWESPIQDEYIEKYMTEHEERNLSLQATTDAASAYASAEFIIIATPTNYDPKTNFFDCSAVETVLELVKEATADSKVKPTIVIKSIIPVGYTVHIKEKMGMDNIIFGPEFLRESKALYDNLYPSQIIVGADEQNQESAEEFAAGSYQDICAGAVHGDRRNLWQQ